MGGFELDNTTALELMTNDQNVFKLMSATDNFYHYIHFFNSLVPGRFQFNFREVIFKLNLVNGGWGISYEIALRWMPLDLTDDKSTLVQVMAWCCQASSHYLSQYWPRSMSPNGVTRPQWVKISLMNLVHEYCHWLQNCLHLIFKCHLLIIGFLIRIWDWCTNVR